MRQNALLGQKVDIVPKRNEAITDYFKIKNQKPLRPIAEKKSARVTAVTNLITAQRQLSEATNDLHNARNSMKTWQQESRADWQQLKERELELRNSFLRFNDLVRENYDKRKRAEITIEKEQSIQAQGKQKMVKMQEQLDYLRRTEKETAEKVATYEIHKEFLQRVVNESKEYSGIQDILSRYKVLSRTESKLNAQQAHTQTAIQEAHENLTKAVTSQTQTMINLQTELATLRVREENIRTETKEWESILSRTKDYAAQKAIETQQVQTACWELYKTICRTRKDTVNLKESDTVQQLDYITHGTLDLSKIIRIAKQKAEYHKPASNAIVATSTLPSASK